MSSFSFNFRIPLPPTPAEAFRANYDQIFRKTYQGEFIMQPNRFDYVKYDETATAKSAAFKAKVQELEDLLNVELPSTPGGRDAHGRAKALALTSLEEVYMWIGKAIRDDQIARNGKVELQEQRNDDLTPVTLAHVATAALIPTVATPGLDADGVPKVAA